MTFIRADICSTGHLDGITFRPIAGIGSEPEMLLMGEIAGQLNRRAKELTSECSPKISATETKRLETRSRREKCTAVISCRWDGARFTLRNYLEDFQVATGQDKRGRPIWKTAEQNETSVRLGNWASYVLDWFEAYEKGIVEQFVPEARAKISVTTDR
ncbi:MAG: hypothetical protein ACI4Q3_00500 [Kiritimatiellia bacterium]